MSIFEIRGGQVTHQYLMRKSKSELAYMVLDYLQEIERHNWINCLERLPEESGVYLISRDSDGEYEYAVDIASFCEPRQRWEKRAVVYAWKPLPIPFYAEWMDLDAQSEGRLSAKD